MSSPGPYSIGSNHWPGLSKLIEESGEVGQVVGKLIATGGKTKHWEGSDLRERLQEELGDLMAACIFVMEANSLDEKTIQKRSADKLALFHRWHVEQADSVPPPKADEGSAPIDSKPKFLLKVPGDAECQLLKANRFNNGQPRGDLYYAVHGESTSALDIAKRFGSYDEANEARNRLGGPWVELGVIVDECEVARLEVTQLARFVEVMIERNSDGTINNCALACGENPMECQMCPNGACPDQEKFRTRSV